MSTSTLLYFANHTNSHIIKYIYHLCIYNSAFYPQFSVLSPFQRFIPISAFYPHFSVLSPFQRFIPISAFYPHFSVLSPFQRFIPISVSVFSSSFRHSVSAFYPNPCVVFQLKHSCFCFKYYILHTTYSQYNCILLQYKIKALPSVWRRDFSPKIVSR